MGGLLSRLRRTASNFTFETPGGSFILSYCTASRLKQWEQRLR
jgi:hypothetical protein